MAINFSREVLNRNSIDLVPASLDKPAAVIVGCMDEANILGPRTVLFGIAGSGITWLEGGDTGIYPIKDRVAFQQVMPIAAEVLQLQARQWDLELFATWHPGCAAAAKQGIEPGDVGRHTEEYSQELGLPFAGGLQISKSPRQLPGTPIEASFGRPLEVHVHDAETILATIGGGITGKEKVLLEEQFGPALTISADWFASAGRRLAAPNITNMLERQFVIGQAIAPARAETPIYFFDAGRLGPDQARANEYYVRKLLSR